SYIVGPQRAQKRESFGRQHQGSVIDAAQFVLALALAHTSAKSQRQAFGKPDRRASIGVARAPNGSRLKQMHAGQGKHDLLIGVQPKGDWSTDHFHLLVGSLALVDPGL